MEIKFKKGPHNTLRAYDAHSGKYVDGFAIMTPRPKIKKSSQEKEALRQEEVYNSAKNSKDEYLFDVYLILEEINPGCVRHINFDVFDKHINNFREIDIITTKAIYEIKSSTYGRYTKQYLSQMKFAKSLHKDHVVFSPKSTKAQITALRKNGINIYNDINEFIEMEKKRK